MSSSTEAIKERLPVAQVIGNYIKLERAGANWKARCPFHNEKTPSFVVSPSRNTYHCFGCNRGGDIFTFVEEIEGVDFKRALEILADRAGITLTRQDPRERSAEARGYALLEEATRHFEGNLWNNETALAYLRGRGLADETIKRFRLGYATNDWRVLLAHLRAKKWSDQEIERTGLIIKSEKGYYDRFRGRITFPVANTQGKIVGFSGRHFIPGVKEEGAKYINTPETPFYNKSKVLYGFDKAKQAIMREDVAVLVEGQMDLVMSHQAGLENTVASSGTALTEEHLEMLKRFSEKLVMAFDGDEAGFAASERGFNMALAKGFDVRVAKLPSGVDPADLAVKDAEALRRAVGEAKHIIDFYLDSLLERGLEARALKQEVARRVVPYIALVRNRIEQAHFVGRVATALSIDEAPVWEEVKKRERAAFETQEPERAAAPPKTKERRIRDKLSGLIAWQEAKPTGERSIDVEAARARYRTIPGGESEMTQGERDNLVLQAEVYYGGSERLPAEMNELFASLEQELLERELVQAMANLRLAEKGKDEGMMEQALARCHELSRKLNEVKQKFKYA